MASIVFTAGTLSEHEAVLNNFLKSRPEVKGVIVGSNFKGLQQAGVPHGTQVRIDDSATLTASLLPEDQGSCVAMFKIKNFEEIKHLKQLQNPTLNEAFLSKLGKGPSFENSHCDSLVFDLGREKANWKPYLDKLPNDPWGNAYVYLNPGIKSEIDVMSYGADGQAGGEGHAADIGSWLL